MKYSAIILMIWGIVYVNVHAGTVITDGSVGAMTAISGPQYVIPQSLGITAGHNLFHSFTTFKLNQGDIAEFTGAHTLKNVISRVTGGTVSAIDGTIRANIGQANFFFMNPAGIIFGKHAVVDVPAALHITTAQQLHFTDGTRYHASMPVGSSFTAAAPEAFGFLRPTGTIQVDHSQLNFPAGAVFTLSAANVVAKNMTLIMPQGNMRVHSQGATPGLLPLAGDIPIASGTINLQGGNWDLSGTGGGNFILSAGTVNISANARLSNHNTGARNATGAINIATQNLFINHGQITTTTQDGQGPNIIINARGNVQIVNDNLKLATTTSGTGAAGNIFLNAANFILDGHGSQAGLGIGPGLSSTSSAIGQAGAIKINVDQEMQVVNGGGISTDAYGVGDAGMITLVADTLIIDGKGLQLWGTGIASDSFAVGNAGKIRIDIAGEMQVLNEGVVSSSTFNLGNAGIIAVKAGSLIMDGGGLQQWGTGIGSQANTASTGAAGNVEVVVDGALRLVNGCGISSSTFSVGAGGIVEVKAGSLLIDPGTTQMDTGIASRAFPGSTGNAGIVNVSVAKHAMVAGNSQLWNGGISSANFSMNDAGAINISIGEQLYLSGGTIETSAQSGNGGPIHLTVPILMMTNGRIITSVNTHGDGGDITINGQYLVMNTGFIQGNTGEPGAQGGDIFIDEIGVVGNTGLVTVGGDNREIFHPDLGKNVIQAAAPDGVNGNITLTAPDTSSAVGLMAFTGQHFVMHSITNPCLGHQQHATFKVKQWAEFPISILDSVMVNMPP